MKGKFILKSDIKWEHEAWGDLGWISQPASTGATQLTVLEVLLNPGGGHNFHKHPTQEEVITVVSGQIEQWLEDKKQTLQPGESVFISANVVHASFNVSGEPAKLLVVLSPCAGETGYVVEDVADQAPWKDLRG